MFDNQSSVQYEDSEVFVPVKVKRSEEKRKNGELPAVMQEDRFWAMLANAMGPFMVCLLLVGSDLFFLTPMLVTAGIYLYFNDRSAWVTQQARQALALQLIGTFGWMALLVSGTLIWGILLVISVLLILVLVGLILAPLMLVAYPLFLLVSLTLPVSVALIGTLGAIKSWNGENYEYPYLGKWLDKKFGAIAETV